LNVFLFGLDEGVEHDLQPRLAQAWIQPPELKTDELSQNVAIINNTKFPGSVTKSTFFCRNLKVYIARSD
jgi:hypothetical protein